MKEELDKAFEEWWAKEEHNLPPMFSGPLELHGLKIFTKLAFYESFKVTAEMVMSKNF